MDSKTYVIVAHGSRNGTWVETQWEWFRGIQLHLTELLSQPVTVHFSFLEMSDPLFRDVLQELDGTVDEIRILPFFLSKSIHVAEDIPAEAGEAVKKSRWTVLETDGLHAAVGHNAARRLESYGARPGDPVVVVGYGAPGHQEEWLALVKAVRSHAGEFGEGEWHWAPAGHFLPDSGAPLYAAVRTLKEAGHERLAVLPLFLSVSSYQQSLIPTELKKFPELVIAFQPDAVLPDEELERWAADVIGAAERELAVKRQ